MFEKKFIIVINEHSKFGSILEAYIINKKDDTINYKIVDKIYPNNQFHYYYLMSDIEKEIVKIILEISDQELSKIFTDNVFPDVRQFYSSLDNKKIETLIKPYIEKYIYKVLQLLKYSNTEIYVKENFDFINKYSLHEVENHEITTILNFTRTTEGIDYHLTYDFLPKGFLKGKDFNILSNSPAVLSLNKKIYCFNVDANILQPFFRNDKISIPVRMEEKWFNTFGINKINKYDFVVEGIEVDKINTNPIASLYFEKDLNLNIIGRLQFDYDSKIYNYGKDYKINYKVKLKEGKVFVNEFERKFDYEESFFNIISNSSLKYDGFFFRFDNENKDLFIDWLNNYKESVEKQGVVVVQNFINGEFTSLKAEVFSEVDDLEGGNISISTKIKIGQNTYDILDFKNNILNRREIFRLLDDKLFLIPADWFERYEGVLKFAKEKENILQIEKYHFKLLDNYFEKDVRFNFTSNLKQLYLDYQTLNVEIPSNLNASLRPYQIDGYKWMCLMAQNDFGGCLADDMGLGKTVQTICMLLKALTFEYSKPFDTRNNGSIQMSLFDNVNSNTNKNKLPSLVVTPKSLVHNWYKEFEKFTKNIKIVIYSGQDRASIIPEFFGVDIILTSYGVLTRDIDVIEQFNFNYIVLDESSSIKNTTSERYKAAIRLKGHNRLILTGTPIENSLNDLWAQFNFLNKGLLGTHGYFKTNFLDPIKYGSEKTKKMLEQIIKPFIIRRLKQDVAKELPEKIEQVVYSPMSKEQENIYFSISQRLKQSITDDIKKKNKFNALVNIAILRQLAIHPKLYIDDYIAGSGKFKEVIYSLDRLALTNSKVLIFSSYIKSLDIIEQHIISNNYKYAKMTGKTNNRQKEIEKFTENEDVKYFLMTTSVGGVGLNLTAADYVFIIDPWWNPAIERQAIDRAHRIGQDKTVFVYRFITENSIEEKIEILKIKKSQLMSEYIKTDDFDNMFSDNDLLEIIS